MQISRPPGVVPFLVAAMLAALLAGCSSLSGATPGATPVTANPLMTVVVTGGACAAPACATTIFVERDGRVHQAAKPPNDLGTVPPDALAALDAAIKSADFVAIKAHPFTGQCPTAYDGQEIAFEFDAPGGTERISTCEVAVDWGQPLFVAVSTALGPFVPLPTT